MRAWLLVAGIAIASIPRSAVACPQCGVPRGTPWSDAPRPPPPWRIAGFRVEGNTKTTTSTVVFLSRYKVGSKIGEAQRAEIERNVFSSELFEHVKVRFETAPATAGVEAGIVVVVDLDDKHSWIIAPTLYILGSTQAVGAGFVENNYGGQNRKVLLYAQIGSVNSFFAGAYLLPLFRGNKMSMRFDLYLQRKISQEYANPPDDPSNLELARESTETFLNAGFLLGWNARWWLTPDVRIRGALVSYRDAVVPGTDVSLPPPSPDGRDVTIQGRVTADRRTHRFGVTHGPYAQLTTELPVPGLSEFTYYAISGRLWGAWRLPREHMASVRLYGNLGYHLPYHDEWSMGAASDLRGYANEQFHGDVRGIARAEYSIPIGRIRSFYFRALGFADGGYIGFHYTDPSVRNYLPDQVGRGVWRSDAGGGIRIYFRNIVLPLLGLDVGYGFENRSTTTYFQVGLTDF